MLIYPTIKMSPLLGLKGSGGGLGHLAPKGSAGGDGPDFGGFPYVGMVARDGALVQSSGLTQTKVSGTTPTNTLRTSISGQGSIQNRYSIPNPFGTQIPATYRNTSFTVIEKFYSTSSLGNHRIGGVRGTDANASSWTPSDGLFITRYDNRAGGYGATYGTNYPNFLGAGYIQGNSNHPVGSQWSGWRSSMLSWDAGTGKVWWAGADNQDTNGSIIEAATKSLSDWTTGIGTQDLVYRSVIVNDVVADWYLIYGKAVNNISDARKYNMISVSDMADPANA